MTDISVVIGTYGDEEKWGPLAERAHASAEEQSANAASVISCHGPSLHEARNYAAGQSTGEWLLFLDADDELDRDYIRYMWEAVEAVDNGNYLIQPATLGVVNGVEDKESVVIPPKPSLLEGNHMVIGTLVRHDVFDQVGGFKDFPFWEDWELWLRCVHVGAEMHVEPRAIYKVHVNDGSRNQPSDEDAQSLYRQIRSLYGIR